VADARTRSVADEGSAQYRGPKGPFEVPAGVLLLQALTHSQHHRGQNVSRMRQLGATPPMTDFVIWYALGRPSRGRRSLGTQPPGGTSSPSG
jgi:uncharacterized damage-inducible protein DinB